LRSRRNKGVLGAGEGVRFNPASDIAPPDFVRLSGERLRADDLSRQLSKIGNGRSERGRERGTLSGFAGGSGKGRRSLSLRESLHCGRKKDWWLALHRKKLQERKNALNSKVLIFGARARRRLGDA